MLASLGNSPALLSQQLASLTPEEMVEFLSGVAAGDVDMGSRPLALATELFLQAVVNGTMTDRMIMVGLWTDGSFTAKAGELRDIRIKVDPALADDADVPLSALPGLRARYEPSDQTIVIDVPDILLESYNVDIQRRRPMPLDFNAIDGSPGALLNYGVYARDDDGAVQLSGDLEAVAMTSHGIFGTTSIWRDNGASDDGLYRPGNGASSFVRLDSNWRFIDPEKIRSYVVGDFITNTIYGASSVRLGGFQYASAFEQRPDIVTTPLPQFSSSAALPSTLDVYLNQRKLYSSFIPSGPFNLAGTSGNGAYRVVATDVTGQVVEIERDFYYAPGQLAPGVLQFSLDAGAPRQNYGVRSSDYDDTLFASGSLRYGLTDITTIQGHAELADGLATLGGGVIQSLGFGSLTASVSGSDHEGRHGGRVSVRTQVLLDRISFSGSFQRTTSGYFDLGRLANARAREQFVDPRDAELLDPALRGGWLLDERGASTIYSAGFSLRPWFDNGSSIGASYTRAKTFSADTEMANLHYHRRLTNRIDLIASAYKTLGNNAGENDYGAHLTLSIRLGGRLRGNVGVDRTGGQTAYSTQITSSSSNARQRQLGWGVSHRQVVDTGANQNAAFLSYLAPQMAVQTQVFETDGSVSASVQARGALVAMDGRLFATNRVGRAFAVVEGAGPNADIVQDGAVIARANAQGYAFLPNLQPYRQHRISVNPMNLPDDWIVPETELLAVAPYRQGTVVNFNAGPVLGAVLVLRDAAGAVIPMGAIVKLDNGEEGYVGHDGQAYVVGLQAHNNFEIDLGKAGICHGSFEFDAAGPAQPTIGPIVCE